MKKVVIAFDVDGTLISTEAVGGRPVANERVRMLLVALASFKNTYIVVWSGGGQLYAKQVCDAIGVTRYVDKFASKNHTGTTPGGEHQFEPEFEPDIAIDDIQACTLGKINLIVREK